MLIGVMHSSLHQAFLGNLYLLTKGKLDRWTASDGNADLLVRSLPECASDLNILRAKSAEGSPPAGAVRDLRGVELFTRDGAEYRFRWLEESVSFWLEIGFFVLSPVALLSWEKVRNNPMHLYWTCALSMMGFMAPAERRDHGGRPVQGTTTQRSGQNWL